MISFSSIKAAANVCPWERLNLNFFVEVEQFFYVYLE
jgi:hypothetical protein